MSETCLELVIFKIKDPARARDARRAAQQVIQSYDGFISWRACEGAEDANLFADLVEWRDLATAKAAGERIMADPGVAALMSEIDSVVVMAHFKTDRSITVSSGAAAA
ncbi:hypothetical protein [Roseibium sp.]|uniref:hypothetical protein n=1 Tax=Roseibium sp. TaxID=1936156 RepID=UPI003A9793D2